MTIDNYNYDEFIDTKFEPNMAFDQSLKLGHKSEDFVFTSTEGEQVQLSAVCKKNTYTVLEFGSFT